MPKQSKKKQKSSKFSAKTADKHDLYQRSVQDAATEVYFINRAYKTTHDRSPLTLREDFWSPALLCAEWVRTLPTRSAVGIDIDKKVLACVTEHNIAPLGERSEGVKFRNLDV